MANRPEITVVVPVYKVEEYLNDCVDSIIAQTFPDFELILVDDGSPDRCGEMCDGYAERDRRVRVIHKENGGLSDARNKGIDAAEGRYITFIDSDDTVSRDYLKCLHDAAIKYDADIVQGNLTSFEEKLDTEGKDRRGAPYSEKVFEHEEAFHDYLIYKTHYSNSTVKLYRIELFEGVRFPKGKYSEDEYTTYRLVLKSRRDVCLSRFLYYYRQRGDSIVHSFNEKRFEVCDELPDIIRADAKAAGLSCDAEVDYKDMRLQFKIYNDFAQGGAYRQYKGHMDRLQDRIRRIRVEPSIWDKKYILMKRLISCAPWLYRTIVFRERKKLRGKIVAQ